jgi:hypothetical protein
VAGDAPRGQREFESMNVSCGFAAKVTACDSDPKGFGKLTMIIHG